MPNDPGQPIETSLAKFDPQRSDIQLSGQRLSLWRRMSGAVNGFVDGFFTPGVPLPPAAPAGSPPRQFDYGLTFNIDIAPRSGMAITFEQLWGLADNWDLLRALIERRKDEVARLSWALAYKDEDTELTDADLAIQKVFELPDGEHDFPTWIRAILEDHFVGDCVSIEPVYRPDGTVYGLFGINGRTVSLKIDERGRTPLPPNTAYQQVIKGTPYANFTRDQLIYHPGNLRFSRMFGVSKVEQIYILANIALRRQTQQLYAFTEGTIPDSIVSAPKEWGPQQIKEFQEFFDARMSGNLKRRSKVTWFPGGSAPVNLRADALKEEFDEWLARLACFTFGIAPTPFIKANNRATADNAKDEARQEGLEPVMSFISGLFNRILRDVFKRPDLVFTWTDESQTDPLEEQQMDVAYIEHAVYSVDEVRQRKGLDPIGMGNAVWTPQGPVFVKDLLASGGVQLNPAPTTPSEPDATAKAVKALLEAKPKHLPRLPVPGMAGSKKKFADIIDKVFEDNAPRLADEIWQLIGTRPTTKAVKDDDVDANEADAVSGAVDLDFFKQLREKLDPLYTAIAAQAAAQALKQAAGVAQVSVNIDDLLKQADEKAIEWAQERAANMVGMTLAEDGSLIPNPNEVWRIDDATRTFIRNSVKKALDEGWTRAELAKSMRGDVLSADRAKMIAQTELSFAHNEANRIGWRESGVVSKKYSSLSADHDEQDECDDNADAGEIPLDDAYPSGDDGPPFHPHCHCGEVAVLSET